MASNEKCLPFWNIGIKTEPDCSQTEAHHNFTPMNFEFVKLESSQDEIVTRDSYAHSTPDQPTECKIFSDLGHKMKGNNPFVPVKVETTNWTNTDIEDQQPEHVPHLEIKQEIIKTQDLYVQDPSLLCNIYNNSRLNESLKDESVNVKTPVECDTICQDFRTEKQSDEDFNCKLVDSEHGDVQFDNKQNNPIEQYINIQDKDKVCKLYKCQHCNFKTNWRTSLDLHMMGMHKDNAKIYSCKLCDYTSQNKKPFVKHMKHKHDDNAEVYYCKHCDYSTKVKNNYTRHVQYRHSSALYKCNYCKHVTKRKDSLVQHVKHKHDDTSQIYKCQECEYETRCKRTLVQHVKCKHDDSAEIHKCGHCPYYTKVKNNLSQHVKHLHDVSAEVYRCQYCDYATKVKGSLKIHMQRKHDENAVLYRCKYCDYTSRANSNMYLHVKRRHYWHALNLFVNAQQSEKPDQVGEIQFDSSSFLRSEPVQTETCD